MTKSKKPAGWDLDKVYTNYRYNLYTDDQDILANLTQEQVVLAWEAFRPRFNKKVGAWVFWNGVLHDDYAIFSFMPEQYIFTEHDQKVFDHRGNCARCDHSEGGTKSWVDFDEWKPEVWR